MPGLFLINRLLKIDSELSRVKLQIRVPEGNKFLFEVAGF